MKISVIGTGTVGQEIASKLLEVGYDVIMGIFKNGKFNFRIIR
jgi:3-hydroxyisobutyrate dehydrogenase-like beta-hydroxyacid dehydrogenase